MNLFIYYACLFLYTVLFILWAINNFLLQSTDISNSLNQTPFESYIEVKGIVQQRPMDQYNKVCLIMCYKPSVNFLLSWYHIVTFIHNDVLCCGSYCTLFTVFINFVQVIYLFVYLFIYNFSLTKKVSIYKCLLSRKMGLSLYSFAYSYS